MSEPTQPAHVLNWNVEWRLPTRPAGKELHDRITSKASDVICLTESQTDFLSLDGHTIFSNADTGYPIKPNRRKVLLWSKAPWRQTLPSPPTEMPSGRFVAGTTDTPSGPITFIGVCIPWSMAHVSSGQRNRTPWEDHRRYLDALDEYFASIALERTVVLGDFNQRIPRTRAPKALYERLLQVFENRFIICTQGTIPGLDTGVIDHIAITPDLVASNIEGLSKMGADGKALTDHDGIVLTIT